MTEHLGQQFGNYRVSRLLGQGGFANVYLGEHMYLKSQAAIKVLHVRMARNDLEGFLNEARLVAHLEHPHIVRVLEFGVEENTPFLIMSYAPNGTLRERYSKGTRLPPTTIVSYVKQVAAALQYAHDRKMIHRDIKPENMLLSSSDEILLSDFGTAVVLQSTLQQNPLDVAGTVAYMSPEQLEGRPGFASDQYALGVVVYEWLSGTRPFQGSFFEVASQHMHVPPAPLSKYVLGISPAVESVVMTALAKDHQRRFASVSAFANALEQASGVQASYSPLSTFSSSSPSAPSAPSHTPLSPLPANVFPFASGSSSPSMNTSLSPESPLTSAHAPSDFAPLGHSAPTFSDSEAPSQQTLLRPGTRLSRRAAIGGLVGVAAAIIAGGSIAWYELSSKGQATALIYNGHPYPVYALAWSPGGQNIASAGQDKTVQIWDATTGDKSITYTHQGASENAVAWSPDGQRVASGSSDTTVQVWDAATGKYILTYSGHSDTIRTLAWSPDGTSIASGGDDNTVQIWNAVVGHHINAYRGHSGKVWSAVWSRDGTQIASASADATVQIWDAFTGKLLLTYRGHSKEVKAISWSHDSTRIASVSDDRTVQVWDVTSKHTLYTYRGHSDVLNAVAWSHNDKYIASGSGDYTVHILDAATGKRIFAYSGHSLAVHAVGWSNDDQRVASASDDHTVQVWRAI
ncbi:MAG TPA: hypothetical protein DDW33_00035 [Ktedonobacter sp.]|nr:hypothetical protein [Ktedonobacter sp.]